jgi:multiple sugar transport system permease protein
MTNIKKAKGKKNVLGIKREILGLFLIAPALSLILVFKYFPIIMGAFLTFFKLDIVNMPGKFVFFDNYIRAFSDKQFLLSAINNFKGFAYTMCMNFWVPIALAILVNETRKGKTIFRLAFFIPACAPAIAMTVLWKFFWQPDYGLANYLIGLMGFSPQMWLNSEKWVYFCMHFQGLIVCGGMNFVIYLSALQEVPQELYESAMIDGAGFVARLRSVTLPHIRGIIILLLTLAIIGSLNSMENIMIMTGGGPGTATRTMMLYAYQQATRSNDYSYAITMTTIVFIVTMMLTILFNKVTDKKD